MSSGAFEQRNVYKGSPERPWIRIRLRAPDGSDHEFDLLADTGNPFAIILGQSALAALKHGDIANVGTNFGTLVGGWLHVRMPELGLDRTVVSYGSDAVRSATKASCQDFEGLAGLPLLRMTEYGGDADSFWVRPLPSKP